jgi:tetratricopeptide (TPR) repeat protein
MKATDAIDENWERRVAELWADLASYEPNAFLERMKALAAELPEGNPQALYELASAYDSTGQPAEAAPLYRRAFASGLTGSKHRQAVIQLAATLRTLGESEESVALLTAERDRASDELDADVSAFLALALVDVGREREATALALSQLSRHLTRYGKSLENYAKELSEAASAKAKRDTA